MLTRSCSDRHRELNRRVSVKLLGNGNLAYDRLKSIPCGFKNVVAGRDIRNLEPAESVCLAPLNSAVGITNFKIRFRQRMPCCIPNNTVHGLHPVRLLDFYNYLLSGRFQKALVRTGVEAFLRKEDMGGRKHGPQDKQRGYRTHRCLIYHAAKRF
jgi:hypothetical protein